MEIEPFHWTTPLRRLDARIAGIEGSCRACGRRAYRPIEELMRRVGGRMTLRDLAGRLRCETCGARDLDVRPSVHQTPTTVP